jgi:hypothetical protein
MRALPGVAPSSASSQQASSNHGRLVPEVAEAIPDSVLKNPIVGEARRFGGAIAPTGWALAQGQALPVSGNRSLFSVLGTSAGGDGKQTFKLPNPGFGAIVAVGGTSVTSPAMLAQSGRHMTPQDSLGPGATRAPFRMPAPPPAQVVAARRLITSSIRVGRPSGAPVSHELAARMRQAHTDARTAAIERLSPNNRARLEAAIENAVAGRVKPYAVVTEMIPALTNQEANALLEISDAMTRAFQDGAAIEPHGNPQLEAARFLTSVAITREQMRTILARERMTER